MKSIRSLFSSDLAIDLDAAVVLAFARGRGIVVSEPSLVAQNVETGKYDFCGKKAQYALAEGAADLRTVEAIRFGLVADPDAAVALLRYVFLIAHNLKTWVSPRVVLAVPSDSSEYERSVMVECAVRAGAAEVFLLERWLCMTVGMGLTDCPGVFMLVHVGTDRTEIDVVNGPAVIQTSTLSASEEKMDEAIRQHVLRRHNLLLGKRTAAKARWELAMVSPEDLSQEEMDVRGHCLVSGRPREVTLTKAEVLDVLEEPVRELVDGVKQVVLELSPEPWGQLEDYGIYLSGKGSLVERLAERISLETGMPVVQADDPYSTIVLGAGKMLSDFPLLKRLTQDSKRHPLQE